MTQLLIVLYILFLTGLLWIVLKEPAKTHYVPVKMLCSSAFLVLCLVRAHPALSAGDSSAYLLLVGYVMCFFGDLWMGLYNRSRHKPLLLAGIGTFLLAHLTFLKRLYHIDPAVTPVDYLLPLALSLACACLMQQCHLHLGKVRPAAILYALFVSSFMVKAIHIALSHSFTPANGCLAAGAMLFWLSDFSLLFLYFYHYRSRTIERTTNCLNLISYYAAMLLLAFS